MPLVDRLSALQNIISDTPGIRLRALSWDAAANRLQLDIARPLPGRWSSSPSGRSRGFASGQAT